MSRISVSHSPMDTTMTTMKETKQNEPRRTVKENVKTEEKVVKAEEKVAKSGKKVTTALTPEFDTILVYQQQQWAVLSDTINRVLPKIGHLCTKESTVHLDQLFDHNVRYVDICLKWATTHHDQWKRDVSPSDAVSVLVIALQNDADPGFIRHVAAYILRKSRNISFETATSILTVLDQLKPGSLIAPNLIHFVIAWFVQGRISLMQHMSRIPIKELRRHEQWSFADYYTFVLLTQQPSVLHCLRLWQVEFMPEGQAHFIHAWMKNSPREAVEWWNKNYPSESITYPLVNDRTCLELQMAAALPETTLDILLACLEAEIYPCGFETSAMIVAMKGNSFSQPTTSLGLVRRMSDEPAEIVKHWVTHILPEYNKYHT